MMQLFRPVLVLALTLIHLSPARAAEQVDLLLVLAADVSRSVDQPKFLLQREGYAAAISDPQVLDAIRSGPQRQDRDLLRRMVGRRRAEARDRLDHDRRTRGRAQVRRSAAGIAALVRRPHLDQRRHRFRDGAARARAVRGAAPHHRRLRRRHQQCRPRRAARARRGGRQGHHHQRPGDPERRPLPWNAEHTNPPGGLENYYRDNVIGGPGAFVLVAENFQSFGQAIVKKLIAEIASLAPAPRHASPCAETACRIGRLPRGAAHAACDATGAARSRQSAFVSNASRQAAAWNCSKLLNLRR